MQTIGYSPLETLAYVMGVIVVVFIFVQLLRNYGATTNAHAYNFYATTLPPHDRAIQLLCNKYCHFNDKAIQLFCNYIAALMKKPYNFVQLNCHSHDIAIQLLYNYIATFMPHAIVIDKSSNVIFYLT
jgi:hypothetical protein